MTMIILAHEHVFSGFPPTEGTKFADVVLELVKGGDKRDILIDLSGLPPAMLISAFINGFLQRIYVTDESFLDHARAIQWQTKFDFQRENVERWVNDFRPVVPASA